MAIHSDSSDQPSLLIVASSSDDIHSLEAQLTSAGFATVVVSDMQMALRRGDEQDFAGVVIAPEAVEELDQAFLQTFTDAHPNLSVVLCAERVDPSTRRELDAFVNVLQVDEPVHSSGFTEAFIRTLRPDVQEQHRRELYDRHLDRARDYIESRHFERAHAEAPHAVALDEARPEAFNVLGVLKHIEGDRSEATRFLRTAVSLDPTYEPAKRNLESFTGSPSDRSEFDLG